MINESPKPKKAAKLVEIDHLLTVPQAAAHLGMGKSKLYELINTNQLAYVPIPSRGKSVIRLSACTLNAWIKSQERLQHAPTPNSRQARPRHSV